MPRRTLLALSLCLNIATALFFIGKRVYWTYFRKVDKVVYDGSDYMKATASIQAELPIDSNDIVFVGNSLTSNFPLYELFPGLPVKNRGVAMNHMVHILNRIKDIARCHPRMIFLEGGINDLSAGRSVDSVMILYDQVVKKIADTSPRTILIIQSTLPVCGTSGHLMPEVDELNKRLKQYAGDRGLRFLDIAGALIKGRELDPELSWDGIHLTFEGYRIWAGAVSAYLPYNFSSSPSRNSSSSAFK